MIREWLILDVKASEDFEQLVSARGCSLSSFTPNK